MVVFEILDEFFLGGAEFCPGIPKQYHRERLENPAAVWPSLDLFPFSFSFPLNSYDTLLRGLASRDLNLILETSRHKQGVGDIFD